MAGLLHALYSWQVSPNYPLDGRMLQNWSGDFKREISSPNHELNPNSWLPFLNSSVSVDISIVATVPKCIMICRFCMRLEVARWKL